MIGLYGVFMLYYFHVLALYGELRVLLREVNIRELQKGKWHTFFLPTFITALVFQ
jgi:hypothetical protein